MGKFTTRYHTMKMSNYKFGVYQKNTTLEGEGVVYEDDILKVSYDGEVLIYVIKELEREGELLISGRQYLKVASGHLGELKRVKGLVTEEQVYKHSKRLSKVIRQGTENPSAFPDFLVEIVMPVVLIVSSLITIF